MSIGYQLKMTQHALRLQMDSALKELSLTTPQYAVLTQLQNNPGISNAALARASFVTAQTMHGIVANLENRKLVSRECDPAHGRILCTQLTKVGLKLLNKAKVLVEKAEATMLHKVNRKDCETLTTLLIQCRENLDVKI